jgi:ferric-dicitrate binding protein FerR (iron transport regulator)
MPDTGPELPLLTREAIAWLLRLTSGQATVEDADAFKRWHGQSPDHAAAWSKAVRLWRALGPALREWLEERRLSEQPDQRTEWHQWLSATESF